MFEIDNGRQIRLAILKTADHILYLCKTLMWGYSTFFQLYIYGPDFQTLGLGNRFCCESGVLGADFCCKVRILRTQIFKHLDQNWS